ncbi:MAG: pyrimidine 5'-nucleotidase [Alphaproteobacteria bacterium]|nr:pyrimidine 5'-nucleotidase [Alphaproteobacteria bacterium]
MAETDIVRGRDRALAHVEDWVFDLDNTLYPASCNLFAQIDQRMGAFISELLDVSLAEARALQKHYFREHGTTMRGLMDQHGVDPEVFLAFVHEIDHSPLPESPALAAALARLPGRKVIFTNASVAHAEKVMARLGVADQFEAIFDIVAADYRPKPDPAAYRQLAEAVEMEPRTTAFVDDIPRNLAPAAEIGMTTVWLRTETEYAQQGDIGDHVHHVADDLVAWLEGVLAARG